VLKYFHTCVLLKECGLDQIWVRISSRCVGYNKEFRAWVGASEFLKSFLKVVRLMNYKDLQRDHLKLLSIELVVPCSNIGHGIGTPKKTN
jgi:hypothetical protein